MSWAPLPPPPSPGDDFVWPGWHWVFIQDVPRRSTPAAWLVGWLPPGHRHMWLAREDAAGLWSVINPASTRFLHGLESTSSADGDYVATMVAHGMTAVRVGYWIDRRRPWLRGLLTCVAIAKMTTGARWWWVQTPMQFVRQAEREGLEIRRP